ncbi:nitroreductase family protein [bacterium]|nr:nitroreductase family protein [bacterium]
MNPVIDTIMQRRSVRFFKDKAIPQAMLETLLLAGSYAPSGNNLQPWRFVVVTDPSFRAKLAEKSLARYQQWIINAPEALQARRREIDAKVTDPVYYGAPAIIFVIGSGMTAEMDCPMACQNIMLAARSFELGSCWVYFGQLAMDDPEIREILALKEGEKIYGPLVLGYPREGFPPSPQKNSLKVKWV